MDHNLKVTSTIDIQTGPENVWKSLTDPNLVKQYFFGSELKSDWTVGSDITFSGEWEGNRYEEKGKILSIDPGKNVTFTYLTTGLEDTPDNYAVITYLLIENGEETTVIVTQEGFKDHDAHNHSVENWQTVLNGLKEVAEKL